MTRAEHIAKLEREAEDDKARGLRPGESFEDFLERQLRLRHDIGSWRAYDLLLLEDPS